MLLDTRGLNRFIAFDPTNGTLCCEAGVLLSDILALVVPYGWFLPVTPGTQFITVGGAIANDVHGKNHHEAGTFGCHVRRFELLRSDGERLLCAADTNSDWFRATIGGLGLTGVILWAEIDLKSIHATAIEMETLRFSHLDEFFALSEVSDANFAYTAAWIDCLARGDHLGRGLFIRGNHAAAKAPRTSRIPKRWLSIVMDLPVSVLNRVSVRAFNSIHYRNQLRAISPSVVHYESFFYPLDGIRHWNRLYGPSGFLQYQCVVPHTVNHEAIYALLQRTAVAGVGSFFAVLKVFGDRLSPGLMSFPRPGVTLSLDFAFRGKQTLRLLNELDSIVVAAGGAVYPAKDARMSAVSFQCYFPQWETLGRFRDARFSSSFWRRVTQM
jgi:FAD/FMN-containing dehydrogenase